MAPVFAKSIGNNGHHNMLKSFVHNNSQVIRNFFVVVSPFRIGEFMIIWNGNVIWFVYDHNEMFVLVFVYMRWVRAKCTVHFFAIHFHAGWIYMQSDKSRMILFSETRVYAKWNSCFFLLCRKKSIRESQTNRDLWRHNFFMSSQCKV